MATPVWMERMNLKKELNNREDAAMGRRKQNQVPQTYKALIAELTKTGWRLFKEENFRILTR